MIHEAKVVWFFQERILNRAFKNQKPIASDINDKEADARGLVKTLVYNFIRLYKTALIDFYHTQTAQSLHHYPHLNGNVLYTFMNNLSQK